MNWDKLKREEERKREAAYDPAQKWLHIQQTITWAEANLPPHQRRNRPRARPDSTVGATYSEAKPTEVSALAEAPAGTTLARRLGDTTHVSGLAIRLARVSGAGKRLPEWLLKVAVERGAKHYQREFDPALPPDQPDIPSEEIGVSLCLGQMPDDPWFIRAAAQLLSSPRVDPQRLSRLAEMERVEPVLLHIAAACERVDKELDPWATLRRVLRPRRTVPSGTLPHWTRFAILPGLTRDDYAAPQWLTRRE
ncbi:MAG: hypothetical protein HYY24_25245 [Verrucomicrobia bacterium]|nr:hypothetical protein [Verrucomicrobiota bacterium]